jgi:hypothetical protein
VPRNIFKGARAVGVFALTAALVSAQTLGVNHYGFAASDAQLLQQLSPSPVPLRMTFYWHNVSHAPNYYDPQVAAATAAGVPILGILGYSSWNESSMPPDFDFTELSPLTISWHTAKGPLPWGSVGLQGTAKYLWDAALEDGRTYPRVVALRPTRQGGFIHGGVPFQIPAGHSVILWAKAGFEQGSNPNARANFSITYLDGTSFPCVAEIAKGPDGALATLTADVSQFAGGSLQLFFNVDPVPGHPIAPAIWQSAGVLVDGVPLSMAQVVGQDIQSVINYPPKDPDAYAAYAAVLAARYPQIQAWEIWNEPNTSFFWRPAVDVQAYTRLLQKTYRAVKFANPNARIILGGLSPGNSTTAEDSIPAAEFLNVLYQNGAGGSFDTVAYHAYGSGPLENWLADALAELRSVMHANGDDAKPIWITEMGCYTNGPGSVSETWQADYLTESITFLAAIPYVERVYWYTLRDGNSSASPEMNYGIFRYDGTAKPAVKAFSAPLGN